MTASDTEVSSSEPPKRRRNPRGEGARLRDEILDAATLLLEKTGSEDAISLRAIARQAGIAPPSVTRHFADVTDIIDALVANETGVLHQALLQAFAASSDPLTRLRNMVAAYVDYGLAHPARYRILVGRRFLDRWETEGIDMAETGPVLTASVALVAEAIQACIDTGATAGTDAYFDTIMLWFAIHGLITVTGAITSVEWPAMDQLVEGCISRAVRIVPATRA